MTDGPPSDETAESRPTPGDPVPGDEASARQGSADAASGEGELRDPPTSDNSPIDVPHVDPAGLQTERIQAVSAAGVVGAERATSSPVQHAPVRPPKDRVRTVARGLGQILITAGLVVLLFVVYEVYVTDIFGHQKQDKATAALDRRWDVGTRATAAAGSPSSPAGATGTEVVTVTDPNKLVVNPATRKRNYQTIDGQGFAKIHIPSFGPDYSFTIIEGTSTNDLYVGPGHYADSQYPGEKGNFAVAGHRVSKGSPFNELGLLNSCDALVIETQSDWFVYRVLPMQDEVATWKTTPHAHCAGVAPQTGAYAPTFGREITVPSDYAQVLPVPHVESSAVPANAERLITLTTCHPQFSDTQRMIIHGTLVKSYKKAPGFLPPELNES